MADNDQNDEYKFAELDSLENEPLETSEYDTGRSTPVEPRGVDSRKNIKRNALIAVGIIVFVMLMYKFIGGMLSKSSAPKESIPPAPMAEVTPTPNLRLNRNPSRHLLKCPLSLFNHNP